MKKSRGIEKYFEFSSKSKNILNFHRSPDVVLVHTYFPQFPRISLIPPPYHDTPSLSTPCTQSPQSFFRGWRSCFFRGTIAEIPCSLRVLAVVFFIRNVCGDFTLFTAAAIPPSIHRKQEYSSLANGNAMPVRIGAVCGGFMAAKTFQVFLLTLPASGDIVRYAAKNLTCAHVPPRRCKASTPSLAWPA